MKLINRFKYFKIPKWILAIGLVLVVFRLLLPSLCLHFINKTLAEKLGNYTGHVEDFDLALYRGAYQLQKLEIKKKVGKLPPLLRVGEIDLSLNWPALLRKELAGDITIEEAIVQIADSKSEEKKQFGTDEKKSHWQSVFDLLIPISIESFKVHRSAIYFTNEDLKVPVPIRLEKIEFDAQDIRTKAKNMASPFQLTAELQGTAPLWVKGTSDILSTPLRADLDFKLVQFQVQSANKLAQHYIPLDFTAGRLDVFGEAATAKGRATGYIKFFFKDGDIIAPKQKFSSIKHFFIEIVTAVGNWILKNNETKKVAARIPFKYDGKKFDVDASDAFWSAVKNSHDQLKPNIENSISLKALEGP